MTNRTLANAMLVLGQFDGSRVEWGVGDLSARTGLTKSHVSKVLKQLRMSGFTVQDPVTRRYRAGPRALALGAAYNAGSDMVRQAAAPLHTLARTTEATATLNIVEGGQVLFASATDAGRHHNHSWPIGSYIPLHATAAGKVTLAIGAAPEAPLPRALRLHAFTPSTICDEHKLLAQRHEIRRCGMAFTYGESTYGLAAIAAPVLDHEMRLVAAISLLHPIGLSGDKGYRTMIERSLRRTVASLSLMLGATHYPYAEAA